MERYKKEFVEKKNLKEGSAYKAIESLIFKYGFWEVLDDVASVFASELLDRSNKTELKIFNDLNNMIRQASGLKKL